LILIFERRKIKIRGHKIKYEDNHRVNNGILEKKCNQHYKWFPEENDWFPCTEEYFYKAKNKTDGLYPNCKRCDIQSSQKNKHDNPERTLEHSRKQYKKRIEYFKRRYIKDYEYLKDNLKRFYKNNPDKVKQYSTYKKMHKEHQISKTEWEACKKYFNYECAYCGLPLSKHYITRKGVTKLGDFHKEHVDHEGVNNLSNCVPSCGSCNSKKNKKLFDEWFINSLNYTEERYSRIMKWLIEDYKLYIEPPKPKGKYTRKSSKIQN